MKTIRELITLCESNSFFPVAGEVELPIKKDKKVLYGLAKYPEFKPLVTEIANKTLRAIKKADKIKSKMPYKQQFVLEEVIKILEDSV
jgi:hypothetical protein